jgi:hypothetical protein
MSANTLRDLPSFRVHSGSASVAEVEQEEQLDTALAGHAQIVVWRRHRRRDSNEPLARYLDECEPFNIREPLNPGQLIGERFTRPFESDEHIRTKVADYMDECLRVFRSFCGERPIRARLELTEKQNCPKFHVDNVQVRLVSTLVGPGTQWVASEVVQQIRERSDCRDHLHARPGEIAMADRGDIVILRGKLSAADPSHWSLHRSPPLGDDERRLVFKLTQPR